MNNRRSSFKTAEDFNVKTNFVNVSSPFKQPEKKKRKLEVDLTQTLESLPETPEQTQDIMDESQASESGDAGESETDSMEEIDEELVRDEIKKWLAENGSAFFHVETTKFLVAEKKKAEKKALKK